MVDAQRGIITAGNVGGGNEGERDVPVFTLKPRFCYAAMRPFVVVCAARHANAGVLCPGQWLFSVPEAMMPSRRGKVGRQRLASSGNV